MKTKYTLTEEQLAQLSDLFEQKQKPDALWAEIAKAGGFDIRTVEDAKTGNPREFMAEPLNPAATIPVDERRGKTSASNSAYDLACPGRHLAQVPIPEPPESADAGTGRRIHAALANEFPNVQGTLSLQERETFDACREIEKKLCLQYFGDFDAVKSPMRVFREQRYWARFTKDGVAYEHSGMPDVVFRSGTKALVVDYKVLLGDVTESPANQQLRDLACLTRGNFVVVDEIAVAIVQPLVTHSPELCVYSADDLTRAAEEMMTRVVASNDPKSPRIAGEMQCKFCRAKATCTEYNRFVGSNLPVVAEPVQQGLLFAVAMANWTPEQRGLAVRIIKGARKRLDEAEDFLTECLEKDPESVPGSELKPGNVIETITNPQGVFDRFAMKGGKLPEFLKCIKVQKTPLKSELNKMLGIKGKALDSEMEAMLDGMTESKQNKPSLVLKKGEA